MRRTKPRKDVIARDDQTKARHEASGTRRSH